MSNSSALKVYNQIETTGSIIDASPHRIVQILLENLIDRLGKAKIYMSENNIHDKGVYISMAITIIEGLKTSLDKEKGGDIAKNLDDLYVYMTATLLEANLNNSIEKIDEVISLLKEIKKGWDAIPEKFHNKIENNE
jgi:flagellar protein FliS